MNTPDSIAEIAAQLEDYNRAYRQGRPLVSDATYDDLMETLRHLAPQHPFLTQVEPELFENKRQVRHPVPMLSTEKAYTHQQLERFVERVAKEAAAVGVPEVQYRITPKLDGLAGRDDGKLFATRGNGAYGFEISSAFEKGVIPVGGRGQGIGEIVVVKSYFEERLADQFEHPRNMVVGIVASDTLNLHAKAALEARMVHFVPYAQLPVWQGSGAELLARTREIIEEVIAGTDYPVDGVVAEVTNARVRAHMGATAHHYRWQIAIKEKGETATTRVVAVTWQVGRMGNVTPVLQVEPVSLSGATIRRVTAHHAGMVLKRGIGPGAQIEIIRSGEVIPKIEAVLRPADPGQVNVPEHCPRCDTPLERSNDFLRCENPQCPAQIEQRISHWFRTLGNADWFGIKTIAKLVQNGYDSLQKIYAMGEADFRGLEFGPVQSRNLAEAISLSRSRPVEDWRFLAAFGIANLGKGDSRKLLMHYPLETLLTMNEEQIKGIKGFGEITSKAIADGIMQQKEIIAHMLSLGFHLQYSDLIPEEPPSASPIAGKAVVFTGKMVGGSREAMQAQARQLGARIQTAVSGSTDYLVCGEKVGQRKIAKAQALGVHIIDEAAYRRLVEEKS